VPLLVESAAPPQRGEGGGKEVEEKGTECVVVKEQRGWGGWGVGAWWGGETQLAGPARPPPERTGAGNQQG